MTATNIGPISQAVSAFHRLHTDDKLATLGLIYTDIADSIPANVIDSLPTDRATDLVRQIQQLSDEEQLFALRDLLATERKNQDQVVLDPHPSKATVELAQGGRTIPIREYNALNTEAKLAFWYLVADRIGSTIIGIPEDYRPSEQVTSVFNSLESLSTNDLLSFLQQVL
jgi:hypothetical protein